MKSLAQFVVLVAALLANLLVAAGTVAVVSTDLSHYLDHVSATEADRVKRGSTTISFAPRFALASVTHLNPQGCASAALPPTITTRSVFRMSVQEFVIAPRPNVGARLATVGPCQTRAWLSNTSMPALRTTL